MKRWLPLAIFVLLLGFLAVGLQLKPREIPSVLINKPVPAFRLATLADPGTRIGPEALRGQVWLLNVWASWCVACQAEHPLLVDFAQRSPVALIGLNYKDKPEDALRWLGRYGNPYQRTIADPEGRLGIDLGVYGVPETFLIDRAGLIRYKHIGPLTPEVIRDVLLPLIGQLDA